ncbi:MAG: hypothetical protein ISS83_02095 [Candidatus Pacebacteria bacterium]|nr:hypothetical protein [Candidatus Paceibacterota bacterium]
MKGLTRSFKKVELETERKTNIWLKRKRRKNQNVAAAAKESCRQREFVGIRNLFLFFYTLNAGGKNLENLITKQVS